MIERREPVALLLMSHEHVSIRILCATLTFSSLDHR